MSDKNPSHFFLHIGTSADMGLVNYSQGYGPNMEKQGVIYEPCHEKMVFALFEQRKC